MLELLISMLTLAICTSVIFKDEFFSEDSIFPFIVNGEWERGINIFAITGCIMILCVMHVVVMLIRQVLRILSKTFGARGETICRMLRSFVKYMSFPFPQVVLNQPKEFQKATELEKMRAEAFNKTQKELTRRIVDETEEEHN